MDEEEFFKDLEGQFRDALDDDSLMALADIERVWQKIGSLVEGMRSGEQQDWMEDALAEVGVNIPAVLMFALKMAVKRNVAPLDFVTAFASGYMLAYLKAADDRGEQLIEEILAKRPEEDDDDDSLLWGGTLKPGLLSIGTHGASGLKTLGELGDFLREQARETGKTFKDPNADWSPVLMLVGKNESVMMGMEIPEEEHLKSMLFTEVIPAVAKRTAKNMQMAGFVVSAWMLVGEENQEWLNNRPPGERIADHPDRQETLFLYLRNRSGEQEMWTAPILRDGEQAPALGEWELGPTDLPPRGKVVKMLEKCLS